ncbi:MAG: glycoside hydrolase family 127 protein [Puniceicoccaceae bacterium]
MTKSILHRVTLLLTFPVVLSTGLQAGQNCLIDTTHSPMAVMRMVELDDAHWTGGLWGDRFQVLQDTMIPYMWEIFQDEHGSHAWANFLLAAGLDDGRDGKFHGPPFNDGDFLKWFEGMASVYAITRDPEIDSLMDRIIHVVGLAQREDGYLHTQNIIPERQGQTRANQFLDRYHFETYNMGHLMTTACVHYRATGKTSMLQLARKAADYLYNFYETSSPELARNAICPSHYMGVVELYRTTREPRYLELAKQLIEIRDLVDDGSDHNQDRVPFREMEEAVGHAVRANYLYAGAADVYTESGDDTILETLETIADDVAGQKLYITGMTGALYDGASPYGTKDHEGIKTTHQAYGIDYQLPNKTAYNETCATIGYAMWNWRMLMLTGEARYADLFENSLYNGVLPGISLDGTHYFYVNALQKVDAFDWPLRWSRTREPNIPRSFCCPPNVIRTLAQVQNYVYSLSEDTVWVNLYGPSELDTVLPDGSPLHLIQETGYPWNGSIKLSIKEAPDHPATIKLRIPGWLATGGASLSVNGEDCGEALLPGTYHSIERQWQPGDSISLQLQLQPELWEANPLVEETANQVALKYGPLVYCLESVDLPEGVNILDVALEVDSTGSAGLKPVKVEDAEMLSIELPATVIDRSQWDENQLYRPLRPQKLKSIDTRWIPYYAWGNRGDHDMTVWIPLR